MRDNHSVAAGGSECPKVIKVLACVSSVLSAINRPESKVSIINVILSSPDNRSEVRYPVYHTSSNIPRRDLSIDFSARHADFMEM